MSEEDIGKERCRVVVCSCGSTTARLKKGFAKGDCPVCGEFGLFPRLYNAHFSSEFLGKRGPKGERER